MLVVGVMMTTLTSMGATIRVNNTVGSGAQFNNFEDAQEAANDGDVIVFDGSDKSYGKITVSKKLTIKGPGYYLTKNEASSAESNPADFTQIDIIRDGVTVCGVNIDDWGGGINVRANDVVVTRCHVTIISLSKDFSFSDKAITNCVIRQNFIGRISCDSYSQAPSYIQITNNIIKNSIGKVSSSVINRNTIMTEKPLSTTTNTVFENNIIPGFSSDIYKNNTIGDNFIIPDTEKRYNSAVYSTDGEIKEIDSSLVESAGVFKYGAFSGDDPYVLSGLSAGVRIQDIDMPESVVQGESMKVTVKIGVSR